MTKPVSMHVVGSVLALLMVAARPANAPMSGVLTLVSPNEEFRGHFGAVAGVGDINQDAIPDLMVGALAEDPGDSPDEAGRAYVFSGEDGGLLFELASPNEQKGGGFGGPASPGDIDQDGIPDLLVGASREFGVSGRAYAFSGQDGSLLFEMASPNPEPFGVFGNSVAGAGHVNQDGVADVIVGARGENPDGFSGGAGRAYVFSGHDGALLFELVSPNEKNGGQFGYSVASAGDVDHDGYADVIVGAPNENFVSLNVGRAYVFSGEDGSVLFQLASPEGQFQGRFGEAVAGAGDVNQDGFPDLIVGADREDGQDGRAYVFSGQDASLLFELVSPNASNGGHKFGEDVAGAGDVNGDGVPDLLVGSSEGPGPIPSDAGRAYVFSGQDGSILFQLASPNEENDGFFSWSLQARATSTRTGSPT